MKRIILFFIAFLLFLSTVEAQQSLYDYKDFTSYEKQRSDLAGEAGKKPMMHCLILTSWLFQFQC